MFNHVFGPHDDENGNPMANDHEDARQRGLPNYYHHQQHAHHHHPTSHPTLSSLSMLHQSHPPPPPPPYHELSYSTPPPPFHHANCGQASRVPMTPHQLRQCHAHSHSSGSSHRHTTLTVIGALLVVLYLTSSYWQEPFFGSFDPSTSATTRSRYPTLQQRMSAESTSYDALGLLGPPRRHRPVLVDGDVDKKGPSSSGKKMPSLLARPLKHDPESLLLFNEETIRAWIQKATTAAKQQPNSANNSSSEPVLLDHQSKCTRTSFWQLHHTESYSSRIKRLRWMCNVYGFGDKIFTYWHKSSNRRLVLQPSNHHHHSSSEDHDETSENLVTGRLESKFCSTSSCPLLVDERHQTLACFVQKVASTSMKQLFMYLLDNPPSSTGTSTTTGNGSTAMNPYAKVDNLTLFHLTANEALYRISPMSMHHEREDSNYFKALFVRHPFVRLVSAFKDKAERDPGKEPYFHVTYWQPLLERLNGKGSVNGSSRVTFKQFVEELLLKGDPYQYDEHWAPIWTRCEPCYMHYDFIGKLENSEADFRAFKVHIDAKLVNITVWSNLNKDFGASSRQSNDSQAAENDHQCDRVRRKYAETVKYLAQLDPATIVTLYKIYYLDFELFGYSLQELFEL